jgi:tetratricopeptide (TPR) repeat protein
MKFGDAARQLNPACVRLIDAMTESGGVGMQHQTTMEAAEVFKGAIFRDLPKIPDQPQSVRDAVTEAQKLANVPRSRADIAAAVVEAGDPSRDTAEPSWAVLGRVMQDTYFAQTHRRVYFMTFMWGLDQREVAAFVEQAKALVGDHPYMPVLEAYGTWSERPRALGLVNGMALRDVNWTMFPFIVQFVKGREVSAGEPALWKLLLANQDDTAVDLERLIRHHYESHTAYKTQVARVLNGVSPHSPVGVATLIEGDWEQSQPKVAQWERDHANHPAVAAALARQYTKLNKLADAKRMWEAALEVSPDVRSYAALAAIHLQEGNEDEWLATLEKALQAEDYGLDHAGVRVQIADHFMAKGDYRRALPYANDAAETWAEWAMSCAVRCHEGLRDWKNAELWVQRISERYEASADNWMMWCLRSGHGDLESATQLARAAAKRTGSGREALVNRGAFELLTGNAAAAEAPLAESMERYGDAWAGLHVAVLRHDAKDFAGRDAALKVCVERGSELRVNNRQRPELIELARLAQRALAQPGGKIDAGKLDAGLRNVPAEERANGEYFAARFFRALGQEKEADDYLLRAANCPDIARTNAVLAIIELRKRGIEVSPATAPATQPTR